MATIKPYIAVPPPAPRFSINEWYLSNRTRYQTAKDQQQLAERVAVEADRLCDEADEITKLNKAEVDQRLSERIHDIEFRREELQRERNQCCKEEEALLTYQERILDALEALKEKALKIIYQCIIMREGRIGIDLVHDEVEDELQKEIDVVKGATSLLSRTLERLKEQLRLLRSTKYFIDIDHGDKGTALKIDEHCYRLKETSLNLSTYHGFSRLDAGAVSAEEWFTHSDKNISRAAQEINNARLLRVYVDTILKQICEDLWRQTDITNEAFRRRIEEIKEVKGRLEKEHCETVSKANDMMATVTRIEKSIAEKEGYMALAHTRLGNRAQRINTELTKDEVEMFLITEVKDLDNTVAKLQLMLTESRASLRYLLKTQVQLEEEINIKTNTLKIDEVDCMTLRQSIDFHAY